VTCVVEGDCGHLPAGVDVAAFRILQEALTNVLKHAPRARASACISREGGELRIDVVDDGAGRSASIGATGHGLLGMRERAELYGGTVTAHPRRACGFEVRATIPIVDLP